MSVFRGFIAIDVKATEFILKFLQEINNLNADIKTVEPQNIHITIKFLGDVQQDKIDEIEQIIKDSVTNTDPFTITFKDTGVFPNKNYIRVVWIGIHKSDKLKAIAGNIDESLSKLGFKKEKREFSAHLTIGRVKTARNMELLLKKIEDFSNFDFGKQDIISIKLKKSDLTPKGPIYTTLKEIKL
jgi:2'-5' RNA ligase